MTPELLERALPREAFVSLVAAILARYAQQNDATLPPADGIALAERLHAVIGEHGLPRPLDASEQGAPGELSEAEIDPLIARALGGYTGPVAGAVKQLVKAFFYPEFKKCRDSFREVATDGTCRRQQLARVRSRVSGAHCVDCPYWVGLTPERHAAYLTDEWVGDAAAEFAPYREIFLPEDFRILRRQLYNAARTQ